MKQDASYILDDLLAAWHKWARRQQPPGAIKACPMFKCAKSPRGWDSTHDLVDEELEGDRMEAIDFHVGEMPPIQRAALQINARKLATGHHVWFSARLPSDPLERAVILLDARAALVVRLNRSGVL